MEVVLGKNRIFFKKIMEESIFLGRNRNIF